MLFELACIFIPHHSNIFCIGDAFVCFFYICKSFGEVLCYFGGKVLV